MLTAVTVIGSGLVVWSNGNLKSFELSLVTTSNNATNKINENLNIENIAFCNSCKFSNGTIIGGGKAVINITLTNTGTIPLTVKQIMINNTVINKYVNNMQVKNAYSINIFSRQSNTTSVLLPSIPPQMHWNSNSANSITITTSRGSIFTTQAAAP